jgi:hypothetical protein
MPLLPSSCTVCVGSKWSCRLPGSRTVFPCACAAFVVGVASYPVPYDLPVCRNDAEDMAWLLHCKGYNVTRLIDPTRAQLSSSYTRFVQHLSRDTTVVIFFAGHGMQLAGANYLVPLNGMKVPEGACWKSTPHVCK